jgi:hypothetical protein
MQLRTGMTMCDACPAGLAAKKMVVQPNIARTPQNVNRCQVNYNMANEVRSTSHCFKWLFCNFYLFAALRTWQLFSCRVRYVYKVPCWETRHFLQRRRIHKLL